MNLMNMMMNMMKRNMLLLHHAVLLAGVVAVLHHVHQLHHAVVVRHHPHLDLTTTMKMNMMTTNNLLLLVVAVDPHLVDLPNEEAPHPVEMDKSSHTTEVVAGDLLHHPHSLVAFLPFVIRCPIPTLSKIRSGQLQRQHRKRQHPSLPICIVK